MHGVSYYSYNLDRVPMSHNNSRDKNMPKDSTNSGSRIFYRNESYDNGKYHGYISSTMNEPSNEMDPELRQSEQHKQSHNKQPVNPQKKKKSGWIRGYGPLGRKSEKTKLQCRLMCCGVPRDSINTLPKQLLLMFDIDHCDLCSETIPRPDTARLHYTSRGHMRNQQKWLSKNIDTILHDSKMPLKSRELYCELCDIQLTSKKQADLHYAGKPHRSIVERRRDPKNVALLHPSMEARLEQLIGREMRLLGPGNIAPPSTKHLKDAPPELSCHICKTVVSCSEQMAMHLNGKKHLNKEKQYIFRLMRGEETDKGGNETNNDESSECYSMDVTSEI